MNSWAGDTAKALGSILTSLIKAEQIVPTTFEGHFPICETAREITEDTLHLTTVVGGHDSLHVSS